MAKKIRIVLVLCFILVISLKLSTEWRENKTAAEAIREEDAESIKVGLLFSTTGTSASAEKAMINAAKLAFDEINEAGGVRGKRIEYIEADYSSTPALAKKQIEKLITEEQVVATVGCYSSASRQATLDILEKYNSLLVYPTYTEGEEMNSNVIYTGAMPNQQAMEYIPWLMERLGKKVFLIGNDYVFPVTCNKQAKKIIEQNNGTIVGETYVELGEIDFKNVLEQIVQADPDFIYCDLVGDSIIPFYQTYKNMGLDPTECPIASITMDEMSLKEMGSECAEGHYASMNYFSTIDTEASREFVEKYKSYAKDDTTITGLAEASYDSCYLLAEALEKVDNAYDTETVLQAFAGLEFDAPQGKIKVDEENHCTWLYSRFAIAQNGAFQVIYETDHAIKPEPWPEILYQQGGAK